MRTSLKRLLSLGVIVLVIAQQNSIAQTITSTGAGGNWDASATWIGGVVPSASSDVVIAGPVGYATGTGSGYVCRNLTVNSGGSLFNRTGYAWPDQILTVNGSVTNNGTIRNEGLSNGLVLRVKGSITHNGTWTIRRTELNGAGTQTLSAGSGKKFECTMMVDATARPPIVAGSDLAFTAGFDLGKSTLDMKSFAVTLYGSSANISNGSVNNAKDVVGKTVNSANPNLNDITYDGSPTIKGRFRINTLVTFRGNVTVADTIESYYYYADPEKVLKIVGNLTNNGIIRNFGNGLALNITGDVTNNGTWAHNRTDLSGSSNQTLTLAPNKLFEAAFKVTDSLGMIVAGSNLATTSWFDLRKCVLDMKNYSLTLQGSGATVYNGLVINAKDIVGRTVNSANPNMNDITYDGNPTIKGRFRINTLVTFKGNVTVADTLESYYYYADPEKVLKIVGSLTNNGLVRNYGNGLAVDVTGNLTANKAFTNNRIFLSGNGNRTIVDKVSQVTYLSTGEKVVLFGENYLPNLSIGTNSRCLLANGSNLYVPNNTIDERLENWSTITSTRKAASGQSLSFFKARVTPAPNSTIDSVKVSTSGHQVPSTFSNAVKTWWRLDRTPKTGSTNLSTFTMSYSDEELGQNVESGLQVYSSSDSGKSWRQISTSLNLTRNAAQNSVSITDVQTGADYLLSSSPDPLSVRPTVIVTVIGRTQIRVGPPNRYTVQYVNNSDVSTGDMLISLSGQGGVFIKQVEPSMPAGIKTQAIPIDSLTYRGKKDSCLLWVQSMAPREERTFDVILNAVPDVGGKINSTADTQIAPLLIAAAWWVGEAVVAAYVTNVAMNVTENIWRPVAPCETLWEGFKTIVHDSFKETNKSWFGLEKPAKAVMDEAKGKLREKMGLTIPGEQLLDAAEATMKGAQRYLKGDFKVKDCSGAQKGLGGDVAENGKSLQKVTSWDPNEKIGPTGYGTEGFMSSAGKMTYQILFENKKEATAPAWRIVIVDTLQADYDATTVEFGKTSHDGPEYQWVKTRAGNILQWSIEGIELPPNVAPPQGEGYVMFSVSPKSTIASGTKLRNRATITFDLNKPIATNEVVNTLDFTPPTTVMRALATTNNRSPLAVRWQSSDGASGAGVKSVTIYASKDGGPFDAVGSSSVDSLLVPVANGDYRFYGLAADYVGNVESLRPPLVQTKVAAVVDVEEAGIPLEFALLQNYPNPFNPATEITFSLSAKVRATLRIYDMLGREIATLLDDEKGPGKYTVKWDAGKNSSGVYFYRLIAGDASTGSARSFVQTRKLMLLK